MSDDLNRFFEDLDAPRPLPAELRDRMEAALIAGTGPRPIPLAARRRITRRLRGRERMTPRLRVVGVLAASLLVLLGSVVVLTGGADKPAGHVRTTGGTSALGSGTGNSNSSLDASTGGAGQTGSAAGPANAAAGGLAGGASAAAGTSARPSLAVSVVGGDARAEAGFRAYVATHHIAFNIVGPTAPSIVTVNLSAEPIATPSGRVLMEGLAADESQLAGSVFDVASVVEHSARIAASTAFPSTAPGSRAVIFTGQREPFATRIPSAIEAVLRSRGVGSVRVPYDGKTAPLLPRSDAAFLSLPSETVGTWLHSARSANYAPARGAWGLYTAADESLLGDMTAATRVVSPFSLAATGDAEQLRAASGALSASSIEGWVTAEYLASAVARGNPQSAAALTTALTQLKGYDDGFAPAYDVRARTNSRLADGVVLAKNGSRFETRGAFVRDSG